MSPPPNKGCKVCIASTSTCSPVSTNVITAPHLTVERKTINQTTCYLLDCGAMANFISKSFTKSLNLIPLCKYNRPVKSLDGRPMTTNSPLVYYLRCNIQGTSFQDFFIGIPTGGYEIVLGIPWFQKTNPQVDWAQHKVYLQKDMGTKHKIQEKVPLFNKIKTHKVLSHQEKEPQEPCRHLHKFYTYRHPKLLKQTLP